MAQSKSILWTTLDKHTSKLRKKIMYNFRVYMGGSVCPSDDRIDDEVVIITGASSGIGKEIALELARRGGHIILAVRDVAAGEKVARQIREISGRDADVKAIDLSSLKNVQNFVDLLGIRERERC